LSLLLILVKCVEACDQKSCSYVTLHYGFSLKGFGDIFYITHYELRENCLF